jgi:thioredoxin-like negative regulator of GroEL
MNAMTQKVLMLLFANVAARRTLAARLGGLGVAMLFVCAGRLDAQEVMWRYDYNTARREAVEKGLPLVVDIGTENCFWCRKLEENTFRDAAVLEAMNQKFIPLKIDARRNQVLAEALRVTSYPTIVLAAPDGKILATLEGYMEAPRFQEQLQRTLASMNNPEWMNRDYQEASRAIAASEYAKAVPLLKGILADGKERPVQAKARQLLLDLEQQAATRLSRAKQLVQQGNGADALDGLAELSRLYAGTQAAIEGGTMMATLAAKPSTQGQDRNRRAHDLLLEAREEFRLQRYADCMERCEILSSSYGDLPAGQEASQVLTEIKNNPELMRQACESLGDRLGSLYLTLAEAWLKKGQPSQATYCLERVVQAFPGTRQAEAAQLRLSQLQGQPNRRADFKNP